MKKSITYLLFAVMTLTVFCQCGGNRTGYGLGDKFTIREECLSATTESMFDELNKVCNAKDEDALKTMIANGYVYVISAYTNAKMVESGFAKSKIELEIKGQTVSVYIANEFLPKK